MNSSFLIPLAALLFNNFTWGFVWAQKRKNRVNLAYIMLSVFVSCWLTQNLILWMPVDHYYTDFLMNLNPIFWLPIGFMFLNFSFAYLNKKKNTFYYFILTATLLAIILSLTTDLMEKDYTIKPWGPLPFRGILFFPSIFLLLFLPCMYSVVLMFRTLKNNDNVNRKKQLILIIAGSCTGLLVGLLTDVAFPYILRVNNVMPLGSTGGAILSFFVFLAVIKYRFMTIDINDIANDLFANVQDGIVILQAENDVIQMNDAARMMFQIDNHQINRVRISTFINNYNYQENYNHFETELFNPKKVKVVSLSQSPVNFANREVGKILLIRDISDYKEAITDLCKHRIQLEDLVQERTLELTEMNTQLLKEIQERKNKEIQLRTQENLLHAAVASLRESEERYRTLAENAFDLICESSEKGIYLYVSPNFNEVLGYEPEELLGRKIYEFLHPDEFHGISQTFNQAIKNMNTGQSTHRFLHKNGEWLWFESAGKPYRAPDGSIRVIFILRDITNRKQIEEEMIKANKLESIGILAGGLAHDFNNILGILWGNLTMAKTHAEPGGKVHQRIAKAEMALIRARELTQQLLIFAKGAEPVKRISSIADLIAESVYFALRGSNIQCEFSPPHDLWLVEVDEGQMNQVFNNLIINAQQAMPDGGKIIIKAQNVTTVENEGLLNEGKYIKLSFIDNGVGIPEEILRKIFDPYFTTKPKGTGLGLATVYSIIKKHNGYISVESSLNIATTFNIYLPALEGNIPPQKIRKLNYLKGNGRILIMDDETELREVLATMLAEIGYQVETAADGTEAIHLYTKAKQENKPFNFIIMDLVIPGGMEGKETIKHLLQIDPQIKAIVSSGYSEDPVMANYRDYGFCQVLKKPYTLEELLDILETLG